MSELDDQHEDLRKPRGGNDGGASIEMRDSRVTRGINILVSLLGIAVVGIGTWIATSINQLTVTVARASERIENIASMQRMSDARNDVRNDNQDTRLNRVEQDVARVEARNTRGGAVPNGR